MPIPATKLFRYQVPTRRLTSLTLLFSVTRPARPPRSRGSGGSYNVVLGAGSDNVTINGTGTSTLTAGSGTDTVSISGGSTLLVTGTFNGSATIGPNSTLHLAGPSIGGPITFDASGTHETLMIDGTTMPTNVIKGFGLGDDIIDLRDTIDLRNVSFDSHGYALLETPVNSLQPHNVLQVVEDGTPYDLYLDPFQKFTGGLLLSNDGFGGTDIRATAAFVAGSTAIGSPVPANNNLFPPPAPVTGYSTYPVSAGSSPPNPYGSVVHVVAKLLGGVALFRNRIYRRPEHHSYCGTRSTGRTECQHLF